MVRFALRIVVISVLLLRHSLVVSTSCLKKRAIFGPTVSCKLKGPALCYSCHPSVCNGCIVANG